MTTKKIDIAALEAAVGTLRQEARRDMHYIGGFMMLLSYVAHRRRPAAITFQMILDHLHWPLAKLDRVRACRMRLPVHREQSFKSFALRATQGSSIEAVR